MKRISPTIRFLIVFTMLASGAWADDLILSGGINDGAYTVDGQISTQGNCTIYAGQDIILEASLIVLSPEFVVNRGGNFSATVLDPDGLSNECEATYFGDYTHLPDDDDDSDGLTNLQECNVAGFNPNSPDSDNDGVVDACEAPYDSAPPAITLLGSETVTFNQGDVYIDAGATAIDDCLGDLTEKIVVANNVNTSIPGTYEVTYDVQDGAGNAAVQALRIVNVQPVFPDLIISDMIFQPDCNLQPNEQISLTVTVQNIGDGPALYAPPSAPSPINTVVQLSTNPSCSISQSTISIEQPIQPGESVQLIFDLVYSGGNCLCEAFVDIGNQHVESNEENNSLASQLFQTVQIETTYQYDEIGRLRRVLKQVQ